MKRILIFLLSLSFLLTFTGCKQEDDLEIFSKNLTTYNISIDLNCETKYAKCSQKVEYINNTNTILKTIKFHLYPQFFEQGATEYIVPSNQMNNVYPNGKNYAEFNVNRVNVENIEKSVNYKNEFNSILSVELNSSLMPNEKTSIYIEYDFTIPNCNHRFGYGKNTINLANFYPIACVYENGEFNTSGYHANGDPFYSESANYSVNISLNRQYIVANTGSKVEETIVDGLKKSILKANNVRDFALVVSNKFQVISSKNKATQIEYYYTNDNNPEKSLKAGIDSLKTFSNLFGEYPYKSFSIVQNDFAYGGMEYPNLIMINSAIENHDDYINVIIHETAHQWWYGIVGNDEFLYPWLDEALTEFSTALFYNYNKGYDITYKDIIEISRENYSLFISVYEDVLGPIDTSMRAVNEYPTEPEYTYCTYVKGVLMYDSLYNLVGEKSFIKSLKIYFKNNKYKNASPENLFSAFNTGCKKNLTNFFSSWINGKVVIR